MAKIIVVFESMLGHTRLVAESICQGAREVAGAEVEVTSVKQLKPGELEKYDKILIGSPTHMGCPTRDTRNLVEKLESVRLQGKTLAFFNCWSVPECNGKGVKSLEESAAHSAPGARIISPGLSVQVKNARGPLENDMLRQAREFGCRVAAA